MGNLIHGDCFDHLPAVADSSVQLLFTSVPDINDLGLDNEPQRYIEFLDSALYEFDRITKDTGFVVLCQSDRKIQGRIFSKHAHLINRMQEIGYVLKDYKIVLKTTITSKDQYSFPYLHLCVFTRNGKIKRQGEWLRHLLIYKMAKSTIGSHHDWPEDFAKLVINNLSNAEDLVVDPFAGSGVVPFVAKTMERDYLGIELGKEQYDQMFKRCTE